MDFELATGKVQRIGRSHFVCLPMQWCKNNAVEKKSEVLFRLDAQGRLIVTPKEATA